MDSKEDIFEAAAALPAAERAAYLDQACDGQPEIRSRLEALLSSHDASGFMEDRTAIFPGGMSAEAPRGPLEQPGQTIGRYKLLEQIGEGGFGVVWMAEQLEPVRRRVAVKVIKPGMDTKEVVARFESERQALAMMDDPNIARVFDAGATESGRPYFVMELVKGIPITKFCDEQQFTIRQRLELFADVCSAITHAHQKGVIHRDIKPTNVMVTLNGDRPVVKVIDFGIAKATQGRLTDRTLFTHFAQFIGTPAYMSPEQAAISEIDVDTRSDIYALGVLLYELLTGKPPFDPTTLVAAGYEEMRRIIREVEPPRPSTRVKELATAPTAGGLPAKSNIVNPKSEIPVDLDWIVMKAIEKDRTRRYETANGLALDIQRFLSDEPVSAAAPGAVYRIRKFALRHKSGIVAAVAVIAVILTGLGSTILQSQRAQRTEITLEERVLELERTKLLLRMAVAIQADPSGSEDPLDHLDFQLPISFQGITLIDRDDQLYIANAVDKPVAINVPRTLANDRNQATNALSGWVRFSDVIGTVEVVTADGRTHAATQGMTVSRSNFVSLKTGDRSRVRMEFSAGCIGLGSNAAFDFSEEQSAITLNSGSILYQGYGKDILPVLNPVRTRLIEGTLWRSSQIRSQGLN